MSASAPITGMPAETPAETQIAEAAAPDFRGVRGLRVLLRSQRTLVCLAAAFSVVATGLGLVPFFCVARMATAIYDLPPRIDEVQALALWAVGAVALRYVAMSASTMLAHVAAFRVLHDLRLRIARKLGDVPLSFFSAHSAADIKRAMMDDVGQIEGFVAHHFPDAASAIAVPVATTLALIVVDWRMAIASIAMAPLAFAAMAVAMRDIDAAHKKWFEIQGRMNNAVLEYFRGIHVIKAFGLSARRFGDLSRSIDDGLEWMTGFMRKNGRGYGVFGALVGSSLVILIPLGGWLHLHGTLSLGDLVLFLILGPQVLTSLLRLMFAWGNVQRIEEGNARIATLLDAPHLLQRARGRVPVDDTIAFHDVRFRYGEGDAPREVLRGISFEARAGTVTALVGPSGAGKTTIARLVPRLWEPNGGSITLGGVDLDALPLDELLARISVVFQEVFLFHGTVRDNLLLAKGGASDAEIERACRAARAHDFIRALPNGYDTEVGERGARLSGGEKQRLSIARAILKDAPILILDEATAFADAENEALIQEALAELCQGRTVIVIAHRLSTIADADQIVVLREGEIVGRGGHDQLLATCDLYRSMWRDHVEARDWTLGAAASDLAPGAS